MNGSSPDATRRQRGRPRKLLAAPICDDQEPKQSGAAPSPKKTSPIDVKPTPRPTRQVIDYSKLFTFVGACHESHGQHIFGCAFNPYTPVDGNYRQKPVFATVGSNNITIYECTLLPTTAHPMTLLANFKDPSPDESFYSCTWLYCTRRQLHLVAAAGMRGVIRVVLPENGVGYTDLFGHGEPVNELRVHPHDSMLLASAGKDFTVRLWNVSRRQCLAILGGVQGHLDQILSLDFDATGNYIVSASMDHSIRLWNIGDDAAVVENIRRSHSNRELLPCCEVHYPVASTRDLHTNYVDCVRFFGNFIFSKSSENYMCLWKFGDLEDVDIAGRGTVMKTETAVTRFAEMKLQNCDMWFLKFAIDPLDKVIVVGNEVGELLVWCLDNGDQLPSEKSTATFKHRELKAAIRQVAFSPNGDDLIAVADDATVWRWHRNSAAIQ